MTRLPSSAGPIAAPAVACLLLLALAAPAPAQRPFDGTDAGVVARGDLELELGPVGFVDDDGSDLLVLPDLGVSVGLPRDWEIAVQGRGLAPLERSVEERRYRLVDLGVTAKRVLRRGSLQRGAGPSLAVELGLLLPPVHDEPGFGAAATGAVSHRFAHGAAHLNASATYTRDETWVLGVGVMLEGPSRFGLRPVAEATLSREIDEATPVSGLAGLRWEPRADLVLDLGFRYAREDGQDQREWRAGLTWTWASPWSARTAPGPGAGRR